MSTISSSPFGSVAPFVQPTADAAGPGRAGGAPGVGFGRLLSGVLAPAAAEESASEGELEVALLDGDAEDAAAPAEALAMEPGFPAVPSPLPAQTPAPAVDAALGEAAAAHPKAGAVEAADSATAMSADPAAAVDPRRVERALERLDPEFRNRLARVVERMRSEHGHEVKVVETLRPQVRQDFLYEQGRTRPGPVVTWTRSSNHTLGHAADVMIDGRYDNPKGYARLAEVAVEEGLRTLGPKDPGHVELPRGARPLPSLAGPLEPSAPTPIQAVPTPQQGTATPEQAARAAERTGFAGRLERGLARVAEVARVAGVAQVAQVAQVASPLRAGAAGRLRPEVPTAERSESREGVRQGIDPTLLRPDAAPFHSSLPGGAPDPVSAAAGSDAVSRLAQVMEIRDAAAAGPVDHVMLRLDNGSGGEDVIRVDLRGGTVGASIDLANAGDVDRMIARLPELQRSLERQGLEAEQLKVRSVTPLLTEAAELVRAAAVADADLARGATGGRSGSDHSSSRERWENPTPGQSRRDGDDPRQQNRRNPKGDPKP